MQQATADTDNSIDRGATGRRLITAAGLMLFVELALIRWLGSNVVHLSYFSNFVLLGSFLGIGAGFLISRKSWSVVPLSLPLLAILAVAVMTFPVSIERAGADMIYFTALSLKGPPAWVSLPVLFVLVAAILAGPAEMVGRCFAKLDPLTAYRYDLLGSLSGIVAFSLLSFLWAPSVVWGLIVAAVYVALADRSRRLVSLAWSALLVAVLLTETLQRSRRSRNAVTRYKADRGQRRAAPVHGAGQVQT
jgi:hypothetical protein